MIRTWKPWKQSTGPRTDEGKAQAARNGYKGDAWTVERGNLRDLKRYVSGLLREQKELLERSIK